MAPANSTSRSPGTAALCLGLALLVAAPSAGAEASRPLRAVVGTAEVPGGLAHRIVVEQDVDQPDMALLTLPARAGREFAAALAVGDGIRIEPGAGARPLFTGEVVAIEPHWDGRDRGVVIRGYNLTHRLDRGAQTRTFADVTDGDIVRALAAEHGLVPVLAPGLDVVRHETVFQHNQSDLEFLRARAAALGFEVWCEDTRLVFGPRDETPAVLTARPRERRAVLLERFHLRLSSTRSVQRVVVRGWDPDQQVEIVGEATAPTILIGPGDPGLFGRTETFAVDHPIFSVAEADTLAQAQLEALLAGILTEAEVEGSAALRAGRMVAVRGSAEPFNGKYLVQGVSHRYVHPDGCGGGYQTLLRVRRADAGLFFLPEIDDEVLVAFEQGDLARPFVVGSLWNGEGCSTDTPTPD
jgi:phage protein D